MKKTRLTVDYSYNFILLGITCIAKEYKLAWAINKLLHVNLKKNDDLIIQFLNNETLTISNFIHRSENYILRLLKNKSHNESEGNSSRYLLPELKNFDYFFQIHDEADVFNLQKVISKLSAHELFEFVTRIDTEKLKSKENLIFD